VYFGIRVIPVSTLTIGADFVAPDGGRQTPQIRRDEICAASSSRIADRRLASGIWTSISLRFRTPHGAAGEARGQLSHERKAARAHHVSAAVVTIQWVQRTRPPAGHWSFWEGRRLRHAPFCV